VAQKNDPHVEQPVVTVAMNLQHITGRIERYRRQHGILGTLGFLASRIVRHQRYLVFEASLTTPRSCTEWRAGERLQLFGPENIDFEMTPQLQDFLGGEQALEHLAGVRNGDRLFVVSSGSELHHCGYILFQTRQTRILGETGNPPLIASCLTAPSARGRGLYRRALNAELCYLRSQGYERAVIETDPENVASRKGIEAAGFQLCREANVWIVLNWMVYQKMAESGGVKRRLLFL